MRTFIDPSLLFSGLRRNSYTQYLIALAIVDSGAILCEGNEWIKGKTQGH